jgi:CubicO group peptidase (beta-lactamase class C family)
MIGKLARPLAALTLVLCLTHPFVAAGAPATVVNGPVGQKLDQYLSRLEALGFSGAVLVAKDGKIVLHKGYGLADREKKIPYTPETVFDIGSITKQFTAAAILKLEMAGKLKVTDPISKYFDGVPADKQAMTLHHLLTHSSGLEDGFGGDYEEMPRDVLVQKALASKLLWAPGTRYQYSNAGYSLLGAIVEKVSGKPYETFLHEDLFKPAGMEKTGYLIPKWKPEELAHGYQGDQPWGTPLDHAWAPDGPWWNLRANGGILSTAGDLYKWHRALEGETILSKEAKAKYFAPHVPEDEEGSSHYGYGWAIFKTPRKTKLVAHNGGNGIFAADFRRYVDEGGVVIAGSAQSDFRSTWITNQIAGFLFGQEIAPPPAIAKVDPQTLARYAGTYTLSSGGKLIVTAAPADPNGAPRLEVTPEGREAFEALAGGVSPEIRARLADREARLLAALEQTRKGSYGPLAEVYGAPVENVQRRALETRTELEGRLGPLQGFEVVGTAARSDRVSTWVRFRFEDGSQIFEHIWEGQEVALVRPVEGLGGSLFVPESEKDLFSYNPRTQVLQRIGFEVGEDGKVKALVLRGAGGEVRAGRS